jgi:hypothetical protein
MVRSRIEDVGCGRPLFVPLATVQYRKFESGEKTVEVRNDSPRWAAKHVFPGRPVLLRRGYSTRDEIAGFVGRVWRGPDILDAPDWIMHGAAVVDWLGNRFFDVTKPLVAFEVVRQ